MKRTKEANAETPRFRCQASSLLRRLSLKHKLIVIIMLTCVASLVLGGTVLIAWEWTDLRRTMLRDLGAHAEVLADNCKTALAFRDAADAGTCLRTVGAVPSIMAVCVYTRGELFAMYVQRTIRSCPSRAPRQRLPVRPGVAGHHRTVLLTAYRSAPSACAAVSILVSEAPAQHPADHRDRVSRRWRPI
jgi:hypothetical protein